MHFKALSEIYRMVPSDFKYKNPDFDEVYRAKIQILTKFIEPIAPTLGLFPRWESLPVGGVSPLGESLHWESLPVGGVSPSGESGTRTSRNENLYVREL